jgi:hypothetical protein
MSILPSAITAKGKHALAQADIAVPEELLTPRDQDDWAYYAACLTPAGVIKKFTEALDQFHAVYHASYVNQAQMLPAEQDRLHSKWNAASILAVQIIERLQFEEAAHPTAFKDAISESLFYLDHFLTGMKAPDVQEWRNRADYYNKIDAMLMQEISNEYFDRQQRAASSPRNCWKPPQLH